MTEEKSNMLAIKIGNFSIDIDMSRVTASDLPALESLLHEEFKRCMKNVFPERTMAQDGHNFGQQHMCSDPVERMFDHLRDVADEKQEAMERARTLAAYSEIAVHEHPILFLRRLLTSAPTMGLYDAELGQTFIVSRKWGNSLET